MADFPAHTDPKAPVPELTLYLKGELPPGVRAAFEAHLPICDRCRKAVAVAQTLFAGVPQPPAATDAPPSAQELMAQMDAQLEQARARNRKFKETRSRNALWALAVLAVIAGIGAYSIFMLRRAGTVEAITDPQKAHRAQLPP
jgi:anti-sigma factor RsiW